MMFLIFCTDQFSTSLAGLWVCSNERAPSTPLQQSIRGIIDFPPIYLGVRACAHSKIPGFIYLCRLFCTLRHHLLCCFFLLLFLTWTFKHFDLEPNIFDSCARCCCCCFFFFFVSKGIPSWQSIPSHTHSLTHTQKIGYAKPSWNSCCTHDIPSPIVVAIFWTILLIFFFFFLLSPFPPLPLFFLTTRKRKFALHLNFYFS